MNSSDLENVTSTPDASDVTSPFDGSGNNEETVGMVFIGVLTSAGFAFLCAMVCIFSCCARS